MNWNGNLYDINKIQYSQKGMKKLSTAIGDYLVSKNTHLTIVPTEEYTVYTFTEIPPNESPGYDILLQLKVRLQSWTFGKGRVPLQRNFSQIHSKP